MRKYGKWVLTLSLLAATPGLTFATDPQSMDANPSKGTRASRIDNQRVAENIANALRGKVSGGELGIEFKDGVAVLSGSVADLKTKNLASILAEQVPNVSRVDNRITVAEKKRSFLDRARGKSSSDDVVQAGLAADPNRQRVQQVSAAVPQAAPPGYNGMYPPGGVSQTAAAPSVGSPPAGPSNQDMANQIGMVLSEARLDGYDIQIRYANGVAVLDGTVGNQAERAAASRAASTVPGVKSVSNHLACADEAAAPAAPAANPAGRSPYGYAPSREGYAPAQGYAPPQGDVRGAGYMQQQPGSGPIPGQGGGPAMGGGMPMGAGAPPYPPAYGNQGGGASQAVYNSPSMPDHAWPTYAQYPNSAAVSYPQQYSASAWPYIGPFYPYPQVPLGWRDATLRWDDGQWNLMFKPRTDRWWWFFNPNNW